MDPCSTHRVFICKYIIPLARCNYQSVDGMWHIEYCLLMTVPWWILLANIEPLWFHRHVKLYKLLSWLNSILQLWIVIIHLLNSMVIIAESLKQLTLGCMCIRCKYLSDYTYLHHIVALWQSPWVKKLTCSNCSQFPIFYTELAISFHSSITF